MNLIVSNNSVRMKKTCDISHFFVTCSYEPVVILGRGRKEGGSCRGDYRWISRLDAVNTLRTGLLNCLNARSRGLTFRHRASCI